MEENINKVKSISQSEIEEILLKRIDYCVELIEYCLSNMDPLSGNIKKKRVI
jgi:hypothetical protein